MALQRHVHEKHDHMLLVWFHKANMLLLSFYMVFSSGIAEMQHPNGPEPSISVSHTQTHIYTCRNKHEGRKASRVDNCSSSNVTQHIYMYKTHTSERLWKPSERSASEPKAIAPASCSTTYARFRMPKIAKRPEVLSSLVSSS